MLLLLTDEHITPAVAEQVKAKQPQISIQSVHTWRRGKYVAEQDSILLRAAHEDRLTLVTFDRRTIPQLLTEYASISAQHSGVIFVDERTIACKDIGGLVRSIIAYLDRSCEWDWANRIGFLEAVR